MVNRTWIIYKPNQTYWIPELRVRVTQNHTNREIISPCPPLSLWINSVTELKQKGSWFPPAFTSHCLQRCSFKTKCFECNSVTSYTICSVTYANTNACVWSYLPGCRSSQLSWCGTEWCQASLVVGDAASFGAHCIKPLPSHWLKGILWCCAGVMSSQPSSTFIFSPAPSLYPRIQQAQRVTSKKEQPPQRPTWRQHVEKVLDRSSRTASIENAAMREIVHIQAGQCGNQIGAKVKPAYTFVVLVTFDQGKKKTRLDEYRQLIILIIRYSYDEDRVIPWSDLTIDNKVTPKCNHNTSLTRGVHLLRVLLCQKQYCFCQVCVFCARFWASTSVGAVHWVEVMLPKAAVMCAPHISTSTRPRDGASDRKSVV